MTATPEPEGARRPVVLVFASYYLPAFRAGGPIRTLANMVGALHREVDFRIFARDHDFGRTEPLPGIPLGAWCDVGGARVFYGARRDRSITRLLSLFREVRPDVVYLNSFFDPAFSILPLALRRVGLVDRRPEWVIAPRGEFSEGALGIKHAKKRAFLAAAKAIGLHEGLVWQASSELEAERIRQTMGDLAGVVLVAPNLTAPVGPLGEVPRAEPGSPVAVCFVGRVSAMKNLRFAIEVASRVRGPIRFDIFGPIEDEAYWRNCEALAAKAPDSCAIRWRGEVHPDAIRETIAPYDAFLLPTLGENFGHAIFESLAAGVPVLVSDRTPWRDLDVRGSGWVRPLESPDAFVEVLESLAGRDPSQREAARRAAHAHAVLVSRSEAVLGANRALFLQRHVERR